MNLNPQTLDKKFSTKTKTIILVLAIFLLLSFVFIYLRYLDTKKFIADSQNFYADRITSAYTSSVKRTAVFYLNRGSANLNSFGIQDAIAENNLDKLIELSRFRWNVLKKENNYLQSMSFYSSEGKMLSFLGEEPNLKRLPQWVIKERKLHGFWKNEKFSYKIFTQSPKGGFIVFSLDPRYFLVEIIKSTGFKGYMKLNEKTIIVPEDAKKDDEQFIDFLKTNNTEIKQSNLIGHELYTLHTKEEKSFGDISRIETVFFQNISLGQQRLYKAIYESLFIVLLLGVFAIIALHFGFEVLIRRLEESNAKLKEKEDNLKQLNTHLEVRVEEETKKRLHNEQKAKEKERMLIHQSKLASMGEMIGNIAHQWRQPLTQLSSILIGIELFHEKNRLSKERLETKIEEAQEQISFMSETIDDFRTFFASGKEKKQFNLQNCLDKVLGLMHASLKNNNIEYEILEQEKLLIFGYENEISQALVNIISNAKDVLLERNIENPKISIKIYQDNEYAKIDIIDNAGGINLEPIEKVFEPYVSTKHASSGTGIGLYMSKTIIEKNSGGYLNVQNFHRGAQFTLALPL